MCSPLHLHAQNAEQHLHAQARSTTHKHTNNKIARAVRQSYLISLSSCNHSHSHSSNSPYQPVRSKIAASYLSRYILLPPSRGSPLSLNIGLTTCQKRTLKTHMDINQNTGSPVLNLPVLNTNDNLVPCSTTCPTTLCELRLHNWDEKNWGQMFNQPGTAIQATTPSFFFNEAR